MLQNNGRSQQRTSDVQYRVKDITTRSLWIRRSSVLVPFLIIPAAYDNSGIIFNLLHNKIPDSKVHGANMGPIWGRQDPCGPHVGPMNFVIGDNIIQLPARVI